MWPMHCDQIATMVLWILIAGVIMWTKVMAPVKAGNFARSYRYENDVIFLCYQHVFIQFNWSGNY